MAQTKEERAAANRDHYAKYCEKNDRKAYWRNRYKENRDVLLTAANERSRRMPTDDIEFEDYRDSKRAQWMIAQIEIIVGKKPVTYRHINQQLGVRGIEMPRGWSLSDLIAQSKKIQRIPGYIDKFVRGVADAGIPDAPAFQVAKRWNGNLFPDLGL